MHAETIYGCSCDDQILAPVSSTVLLQAAVPAPSQSTSFPLPAECDNRLRYSHMLKDYVVTREMGMAEDKTTQLQEMLECFNLSSCLHRFVPTTKNASVPCAKGREGHPGSERLFAGSAVVVHPLEKAPTVAP